MSKPLAELSDRELKREAEYIGDRVRMRLFIQRSGPFPCPEGLFHKPWWQKLIIFIINLFKNQFRRQRFFA